MTGKHDTRKILTLKDLQASIKEIIESVGVDRTEVWELRNHKWQLHKMQAAVIIDILTTGEAVSIKDLEIIKEKINFLKNTDFAIYKEMGKKKARKKSISSFLRYLGEKIIQSHS